MWASAPGMNQPDDSIASLPEPETFIQSAVIRNDSFALGGRTLEKLLKLVTVCDILEIKSNASSQLLHSIIRDTKPNSSLGGAAASAGWAPGVGFLCHTRGTISDCSECFHSTQG